MAQAYREGNLNSRHDLFGRQGKYSSSADMRKNWHLQEIHTPRSNPATRGGVKGQGVPSIIETRSHCTIYNHTYLLVLLLLLLLTCFIFCGETVSDKRFCTNVTFAGYNFKVLHRRVFEILTYKHVQAIIRSKCVCAFVVYLVPNFTTQLKQKLKKNFAWPPSYFRWHKSTHYLN
jgi:hypothetical protein